MTPLQHIEATEKNLHTCTEITEDLCSAVQQNTSLVVNSGTDDSMMHELNWDLTHTHPPASKSGPPYPVDVSVNVI